MAGDWIKIQHVTPDKPEIYQIAADLGVTPEDAFGRCVRLWIWADQQSLNGHALSVTLVTLDSVCRRDGFGAALLRAGWVAANSDGTITLPHFDRHNGETAKQRGLAVNRKAKQRSESHGDVAEMSREHRDKSVTREEKRREDIKPTSMSGTPDVLPPKINGFKATARTVLAFLNEKTGRDYQPVESNLSMIVSRLKEGYTEDDLRQIIVRKGREWSADEKMAQYLRPATLFNAQKCAQYRGELV